MKKLKDWKITRAIKASALCIRFPFLYPRNRFSNRHVSNVLGHKCYNLYKESVLEIGLSARLEKEPCNINSTWENFLDVTIKLNKETRKLLVKNSIEEQEIDLNNLLWNSDSKFEILGMSLNFALTGRPLIIIHVKTKDEKDKTIYGFHHEDIKLLTNKRKYNLYKVLTWIDREILDRIFFIPNHTELDAMPDGWRKAFGIDMCKDIKKSLLKTGGRKALRNYRIEQIKEKFGGLRLYDAWSTEEILHEIVPKYTDLSYKTCINCGKPATCVSTGWISPYCDDCKSDKGNYVPMTEDNAWNKAYTYYWPKKEE